MTWRSFMQTDWKKDFEIGILEIDRAHTNLFNQFNDFVELSQSGAKLDLILQKFITLIENVESHFMEEEEIMAKINFHDLQNHALIHKQLLDDAKEVTIELSNADEPADMLPYITCLQKLIIEHVLYHDSQIKAN